MEKDIRGNTAESTEDLQEQFEFDAIDKVSARMYENARAKGFHDNDRDEDGNVTVERLGMFCSNLHGEVSELWEVVRKGKLYDPCDKTDKLTNAEEELADIVIRAMDTAHTLGISLGDAIKKKHAYNRSRPYKHGKKC